MYFYLVQLKHGCIKMIIMYYSLQKSFQRSTSYSAIHLVSIYYISTMYKHYWMNQICLNKSFFESRGLKPMRPTLIRTVIKILKII